MKKNRNLVILFSLLSVAVLAASAVALWFFSNPEGATRQAATANLVTFAVRTLTLSAVTGFAAMATLETMKRLFHLRGRFFFDRAAGPEFLRLVRPGKPVGADPGEDIRRFDLPLEQIMAQLGRASDQALLKLFVDRTEPSGQVAHAEPADQATPAQPPDPPVAAGPAESADQPKPPLPGHEPGSKLDAAQQDTAEYKFLAKLMGKGSLATAETAGDPTLLRLDTQAALDDLQVSVGNAWQWRLRLAACMLSALFALAALIFVPVPPGSKIAALAGSFLLGGFLAGFFRDLAAIIERFRG